MYNKLTVIFLSFFMLFCNFLLAQPKEVKQQISAIELSIKNATAEEKVAMYLKISSLLGSKFVSKQISYLNDAEKIINKNKLSNSAKQPIYHALAECFYAKHNYKKACDYYNLEIASISAKENYKLRAKALYGQAKCYNLLKNVSKAANCYYQAALLGNRNNDTGLQADSYKNLYLLYKSVADYKNALESYIKYASFSRADLEAKNAIIEEQSVELKEKDALLGEKDSAIALAEEKNLSLQQDSANKAFAIELLNTEKSFQEKKLADTQMIVDESKSTIERQNLFIFWGIVFGVVIIGLLVVLIFMLKKIKRINQRLETQKSEIEQQKALVEIKNNQITDSINYARKIQDSILVPESKIKRWLPQMFIYYKPKDIVSGDFYWFSKYENKYVITAIDCTGHGVPGAFLSMIGNTLLHEIVNIKHVFKPDLILAMLHTGITLALNQDGDDSDSEDGMDMSLCTVDTKLHRFQFAGAKNNLYVVQGDKLKILKANYYSVGGKPLRPDMKVEFTCYDFMYDDNTSIYMFSDGYLDQFGGNENEKFNAKRFRELILSNRKLPMAKQKQVLSETMDNWKGNRQQIDDFLVLGVKLAGMGIDNDAESVTDSEVKQ